MTTILWLITMFKYSFSILVLVNTIFFISAAIRGAVLIIVKYVTFLTNNVYMNSHDKNSFDES